MEYRQKPVGSHAQGFFRHVFALSFILSPAGLPLVGRSVGKIFGARPGE